MINCIGLGWFRRVLLLGVMIPMIFCVDLTLLADEERVGSPETGGPVLTVVNETEYDLRFTVAFPEPNASYLPNVVASWFGVEEIPLDVPKGESKELRFVSWDGLSTNWFGVPGEVSEKLKIKAINSDGSDAWDEEIEIKLVKEKKGKSEKERVKLSYSDFVDPLFESDIEKGLERTPRINWNLKWNKNGWKITLKQLEGGIDTGVRDIL